MNIKEINTKSGVYFLVSSLVVRMFKSGVKSILKYSKRILIEMVLNGERRNKEHICINCIWKLMRGILLILLILKKESIILKLMMCLWSMAWWSYRDLSIWRLLISLHIFILALGIKIICIPNIVARLVGLYQLIIHSIVCLTIQLEILKKLIRRWKPMFNL